MAKLSRLKSQLDTKLGLPNKYLGRTVWNSPQGSLSCNRCKWWAPSNPDIQFDPEDKRSYELVCLGICGQLRIAAMFGGPPPVYSYYYCNYYEEKEKENEGN